MTADLVTLVTSDDQVIGSMDKLEAHRGEGQLHRAVSVYLFRKNTSSNEIELLIQKRSAQKIVGGLQWANTICGNVRPTENHLQCAQRRLREELGIKNPEKITLQLVTRFQYQVRCNDEFSENEVDTVFVGFADVSLELNPQEVQEIAWENWHQISSDPQKLPYNFAPWFLIMMKRPDLRQAIGDTVDSASANLE